MRHIYLGFALALLPLPALGAKKLPQRTELLVAYPGHSKTYVFTAVGPKGEALRLTLISKGQAIQEVPVLPSVGRKLLGEFRSHFARPKRFRLARCQLGVTFKSGKVQGQICPQAAGLQGTTRLTNWRRKVDGLLAMQSQQAIRSPRKPASKDK